MSGECQVVFVTDSGQIRPYLRLIVAEESLMILKQLRISRLLSQEQLAQMSGLSVRTIQRIESGKNASTESLKCLAAALDENVSTLQQEKFMPDKESKNWKELPWFVKLWFSGNFTNSKPNRKSAKRIEVALHVCGFLSCSLALVEASILPSGLLMLVGAYSMHLARWQGDKYGVWYDETAQE